MPLSTPSSKEAGSPQDQSARQWFELVDLYVEQLEKNPKFLENEAEELNLPSPERLIPMFRKADPAKSLALFADKNPDLDLKSSPPLKLAQGLLVTAANLEQ